MVYHSIHVRLTQDQLTSYAVESLNNPAHMRFSFISVCDVPPAFD